MNIIGGVIKMKSRDLTPEEQIALFDSFDDNTFAVQGISPILEPGLTEKVEDIISGVLNGSYERAFDLSEENDGSVEERLSMFGEMDDDDDLIHEVIDEVDRELSSCPSKDDPTECDCHCHHTESDSIDSIDGMIPDEEYDDTGIISVEVPFSVFPQLKYSSFNKYITLDDELIVDAESALSDEHARIVLITSLAKLFRPTMLLSTEEMLRIAKELPTMPRNIIFNQRELTNHNETSCDPPIIYEAFIFTPDIFDEFGNSKISVVAEKLFSISNSPLKRNLMVDYAGFTSGGDDNPYEECYSLEYDEIKAILSEYSKSYIPEYKLNVKDLLNNPMMEADTIEELIDLYEANPTGSFEENIDPVTGEFKDIIDTPINSVDALGNDAEAEGGGMVIDKRI